MKIISPILPNLIIFFGSAGELGCWFTKSGSFWQIPWNGKLYPSNLKDGKWEGPFERYYENGKLESKGTYKDGKYVGPWFFYRENGKLELKATYKDGKEDGPYVSYRKTGKLDLKGIRKHDKWEGLLERYDRNGKVYNKETYKDGKLMVLMSVTTTTEN